MDDCTPQSPNPSWRWNDDFQRWTHVHSRVWMIEIIDRPKGDAYCVVQPSEIENNRIEFPTLEQAMAAGDKEYNRWAINRQITQFQWPSARGM